MIALRVVLLLLIFANLLLLFWGQGFLGGQTAPGEPERLANQLAPEKIRIVQPAEKTAPAPAEKTEAAAAPKVETTCVAIGGLPKDQAKALADKITAESAGLTPKLRAVAEIEAFWVMYPEQPTRALADRKAAELRGLGVTDLFVMNEGPNANAISLGLFKSREKAEEHLKDLRQKGVRYARMVSREGQGAKHFVDVSGPKDAVNTRVAEALKTQRGAERAACGTRAR